MTEQKPPVEIYVRREQEPGARQRAVMDSTVDEMEAAYDALVEATAAAIRERGCTAAPEDVKRCVDAFNESCDQAEGLVQAAAASLGHPPGPDGDTRIDALCGTVQAIEDDLQGAAGDQDKQENTEKDAAPPVEAEDK